MNGKVRGFEVINRVAGMLEQDLSPMDQSNSEE
jgi:hypothetical protein